MQNIELLAKDLNHQGGVMCPSPLAKMQTWNTHPKVYSWTWASPARPSARIAGPSTNSRMASISTGTKRPRS
jgi:hypothetical protein